MQFMYLRRNGKKNNPGRHPIGMIGVQKKGDNEVEVFAQMIHNKDRFDKKIGRKLLEKEMYRKRTVRLTPNNFLTFQLHEVLPDGFGSILDNYVRHQEILTKLVQDEFSQGSWAKSQDAK